MHSVLSDISDGTWVIAPKHMFLPEEVLRLSMGFTLAAKTTMSMTGRHLVGVNP